MTLVFDRLEALVLVLLDGEQFGRGIVLGTEAGPETSRTKKICFVQVVVSDLVVAAIFTNG